MSKPFDGPADEARLIDALKRAVKDSRARSIVVSDGLSERAFHFTPGAVAVVRTGPRRSAVIGELLVGFGWLTVEQLDALLEDQRSSNRPFGEIAVAKQWITSAQLDRALRAQLEEEFTSVFLWPGAEIRVLEGRDAEECRVVRAAQFSIACDAASIVQSIIARIDAWRSIVGSLHTADQMYVMGRLGKSRELPRAAERLVSLLDGSRLAIDAIEDSGLPRTVAYGTLLQALRDGLIVRPRDDEAMPMIIARTRVEVDQLEAALPLAVDRGVLLRRLAAACERIGDAPRAARYHRRVAELLEEGGHLDAALRHVREAVRLVPDDLASMERAVELLNSKGERQAFTQAARSLAETFVTHGLMNRAAVLLERLVEAAPDDDSLRARLVDVRIGMGNRDEALEHLRHIAARRERSGADAEALLPTYLRILGLDSSDRASRRRVDELTGVARQRRIFAMTAVASAGLLVLGTLAFLHEQAGRNLVNAALRRSAPLIEDGQLPAARAVLASAADEADFSSAESVARRVIARIREAERRAEQAELIRSGASGVEKSPAQLRAERQERQELEERTRLHVEQVATEIRAGRFGAAHGAAQNVFAGASETDAIRGLVVPLQLDVQPANAAVYLGDRTLSAATRSLTYSPGKAPELRVEAAGFEPYSRVLDSVIDLRLRVQLSRRVEWQHASDAPIDSSPLVVDGRVLVAGRDRTLRALDAQTGELLWSTPLGLYSDVAASPAAWEGSIVVVTALGEAISVDAESGYEQWRSQLDVRVSADPVLLRNGRLIVVGEEGEVVCARASDGAIQWSLPAGTSQPGTAPWPVGDKSVVFAERRGIGLVSAVDGTRSILGAGGLELRSAPAGDGSRIWAVSADGSLRSIGVGAGMSPRRTAVSGLLALRPTAAGGVVYVGCDDGTLAAHDGDGSELFRTALGANLCAPATVGDRRVVAALTDGSVVALDRRSGDVLWRGSIPARACAAPVVGDGLVFVPAEDGTLTALQL